MVLFCALSARVAKSAWAPAFGTMPSSLRREKRRLAKAREAEQRCKSDDVAASIDGVIPSSTGKSDDVADTTDQASISTKRQTSIGKNDDELDKGAKSKMKQPVTTKNAATQTPIHAEVLKELVEKYWRMLDLRQVDQASEPYQFIMGTSSGLTTSSSRLAGPLDYDDEDHDAHDDDPEEDRASLYEYYIGDYDDEYDMEMEYLLAFEEERATANVQLEKLD